MSRIVGLSVAVATGLYTYVGGFHDTHMHVGPVPFDSLRVRYKVNRDPYELVPENVEKEYDAIVKMFPNATAKSLPSWWPFGRPTDVHYAGLFFEDPVKVRQEMGDAAKISYAIAVVVDSADDDKDQLLAAKGFKETTLQGGGKAMLADFPVRLGFFRPWNKFTMIRRVYPRLRTKIEFRDAEYTGAMEYYANGNVTISMPMDPSLTDNWSQLEGLQLGNHQ